MIGDKGRKAMDAIDEMVEAGDVGSLGVVLRRAARSGDRLRAARALGELMDRAAAPDLIDCAIGDDEPEVRRAAEVALRALLGAEAQTALTYARSTGEVEASDVLSEFEYEVLARLEGEPPESYLDESDVPGLVMVIQSETDRAMRLRAIRGLGAIHNLEVYRVLGELALWDEDPAIREAAQSTLVSLLGENAPDWLAALREEWEGDEEDDSSGEPFEEDEETALDKPRQALNTPSGLPSGWDLPKGTPVMREEGTPAWLWLVLLGLALAAGVWWFLLR